MCREGVLLTGALSRSVLCDLEVDFLIGSFFICDPGVLPPQDKRAVTAGVNRTNA